MDLDKLKKKRKTERGVVTKLLNKIAEAQKTQKAEKTDFDPRLLKQWTASSEENYQSLKKLDSDILEAMIEKDAGENDCEQEADAANEIREKISYTKICLQDILGEIEKPRVQRRDSNESNSGESNANEAVRRRAKAKLPQLELKKFTGKVSQWQEFWDAFESAIHEDEDSANK